MKELKEQLIEYLKNAEGGKLSSRVATFINHNFGNIKQGGKIKQYIFFEDDEVSDVLFFLKTYYPEIWEEYSGS